MHTDLRTLVGAADYALYVKDPVLFSRVDALYRHVRSRATRFGFLAEVVDRRGDVICCETCVLMDFIGLAVTLANNGHPEYWGDVERTLRNQLVESQVTDASWLAPAGAVPIFRSTKMGLSPSPDTDQFTWREVGARMVGGYAGWSSPTHILAAREDLHWGKPNLRGKTRAFQNCCGGSGTHAFFIAWKNAARFYDGTLSVHLHIDKLLPQAEIRCYQPYKGLLTISLKQPCKVRVRIPEFVVPTEIRAKSNNGEIQATVWGNYLELGDHPAGEMIEVSYPLPVREEETDDRQSRLPAIPLPRDLEGRYGRADDASRRPAQDRLFRLREEAGCGILRRQRPRASLPARRHAEARRSPARPAAY